MNNYPPSKAGYMLEFHDEFNNPSIQLDKWIPYYLPQWSSREKSKPEYHIAEGNLVLKITAQQQPWCPEFNGDVKVSSLQTGLFAGPLDSTIGQHKFNKNCKVREEQQTQRTYTPQYGYIEIRAKAKNISNDNVIALWMIGFEDTPEKSAEICIVEIKGHHLKKNSAIVGYGLRPFNDPTITNEFFEENFALDATEFHTYAADWSEHKIDFYIDGKRIKTVHQSPQYPMQLMLNIYEVPAGESFTEKLSYPNEFIIDYIRGYKRIDNEHR